LTTSIRVHDIVPQSEIYGPGTRWVLWVQGCTMACEGCWNTETWSKRGGTLRTVESLLREIAETGEIEGITILGGEPLQQAEPVLALIEGAGKLGFTVMLYTGYEPHEFDGVMQACYDASDIAITGRYVAEQRDLGLLWRGSANQVIESPTGRYADLEFEEAQEVEFLIDHETGQVTMLGYPDEQILSDFKELMGNLQQ